jgi:hypothetical protein
MAGRALNGVRAHVICAGAGDGDGAALVLFGFV